jgi:PAS domain S-box-containing protein
MAGDPLDERPVFLAMQPAERREWRLAAVAIFVSIVVLAALAPFAGKQLPRYQLFLPIYQSALVICDVITAILLFGQFRILRSMALLVLAGGYVFTASMAICHALSFPGLFSPNGLLGSGPQTTAWLYFLWRVGFAATVILYGVMKDKDLFPSASATRGAGHVIAATITAAIAAAAGLMAFTTLGHGTLPVIMRGDQDMPAKYVVAWAAWLMIFAALPVLWRRRRPSVLDLWLIVVMCAWLCDVALAAGFNAGRFSVGWYAGRAYGLLASSFLLAALMVEDSALYGRLVETVAAERKARKRLEEQSADLRRATDSLHEERDFVEGILGTTSALIVVLDSEGRIVRLNKASEDLSGRTTAELRGKYTWEVLVPDEEREAVKQAFDEMMKSCSVSHSENHWQQGDGSRRLIAWTRTCVSDPAGRVRYVIATGIDITDARRAEQEAHDRQAEVARLHRLHTMGELASLVAHELNQPLAAIAIYGETSLGLLQRDERDDRLRQNLQHMVEQAHRASRSIRQMRQFLTKKQPDKVSTELEAALQFACGLVEDLAKARGVELDCRTDASLPSVMAPAIQIEHVLVNLLQNALDAIRDAGKKNGRVTVRVHREDPKTVRVRVEDNGPGLDRSLAEKVFEPLYTTKSDGLGLGLSICRSIVEALGGRIWAEPGPGGKFYFTLPVAP